MFKYQRIFFIIFILLSSFSFGENFSDYGIYYPICVNYLPARSVIVLTKKDQEIQEIQGNLKVFFSQPLSSKLFIDVLTKGEIVKRHEIDQGETFTTINILGKKFIELAFSSEFPMNPFNLCIDPQSTLQIQKTELRKNPLNYVNEMLFTEYGLKDITWKSIEQMVIALPINYGDFNSPSGLIIQPGLVAEEFGGAVECTFNLNGREYEQLVFFPRKTGSNLSTYIPFDHLLSQNQVEFNFRPLPINQNSTTIHLDSNSKVVSTKIPVDKLHVPLSQFSKYFKGKGALIKTYDNIQAYDHVEDHLLDLLKNVSGQTPTLEVLNRRPPFLIGYDFAIWFSNAKQLTPLLQIALRPNQRYELSDALVNGVFTVDHVFLEQGVIETALMETTTPTLIITERNLDSLNWVQTLTNQKLRQMNTVASVYHKNEWYNLPFNRRYYPFYLDEMNFKKWWHLYNLYLLIPLALLFLIFLIYVKTRLTH